MAPKSLGSSLARRGADGSTTIYMARPPTLADGRLGDAFADITPGVWLAYGPKGPAGWPGEGHSMRGPKGWTPVIDVVNDGARRVLKIVDWTGGAAPKPAVNVYLGTGGFTANIGDAIDVRGAPGPEALIDALDAALAAATDVTLIATGEDGEENEKRALIELFVPGDVVDRRSVAHAQATIVPKDIRRMRVAEWPYRRTDSEPETDGGKFRSLDRWTASGATDSVDGGWWALDALEASLLAFGVSTTNSAAENRVVLQYALDWAHALYLEVGSPVRLKLPSGRYPWGDGAYDAVADWRHICHVYDGVIIEGPGTLVSDTPFATRSVGFVVRGDFVAFERMNFDDVNSVGNCWIIPIGAGNAYDSGLTDGRTYKSLTVDDCRFKNAWLPASVQFYNLGDTTVWDGFVVRDSVFQSKTDATTAGGFNARAHPPGRIKNVRMQGNTGFDGKTASSYNLLGVHGFSIIGNESHRNLYGGVQIENGCEQGTVLGLDSYDEMTGVWIDDSRRINWGGISMRTVTETLVTPGLGTAYRSRNAVRISHQGFTEAPDYVTTDIVGGGLVGEFNRVEIGVFTTPIGNSRIDRVIIDGYTFSGDGTARTGGNIGIVSSNVHDLSIANARFTGALSTAISLAIPEGGVARLHNVTTKKVGAESTVGLSTVGLGRLSLVECDLHTVSYGHSGGIEATAYRINGVKQPDARHVTEVGIADDAVAIIPLPAGRSSGVIYVELVGSNSVYGWVHLAWSGVAAYAAAAGTNGAGLSIITDAGILENTPEDPSTDTKLTVRNNVNGNYYLRNRTGAAATFRVRWD